MLLRNNTSNNWLLLYTLTIICHWSYPPVWVSVPVQIILFLVHIEDNANCQLFSYWLNIDSQWKKSKQITNTKMKFMISYWIKYSLHISCTATGLLASRETQLRRWVSEVTSHCCKYDHSYLNQRKGFHNFVYLWAILSCMNKQTSNIVQVSKVIKPLSLIQIKMIKVATLWCYFRNPAPQLCFLAS